MVRDLRIFFCLGLSALLLSGCERASSWTEDGRDVRDWNVLLVTFDTTRADHLSPYGKEDARTPTLDRLAAEGVLFEQAVAPVPITLPSHSSLMTGKVPFAHGVRDNGLFSLGDEQTTLAEILRERGYRTAAAVGSFPLTKQFGIGQGFELYDDHVTARWEDLWGDRVLQKQQLFFDERKAAQVNEAVLPWLEEHHAEPFFLWIHYFDPHHPHNAPAPWNETFAHDPYGGEIAYSDESLGILIEHLERLGVEDETLIVFTSDHGEGRDEHNESTHSMLVYQSTLHVPLIVRVPGGEGGRRVPTRVGTVDVMPTVLDLLGIETPQDIQGRSLRRLLEGRTEERPRTLYAETLSPRLSRGWGELRALFVGDEKYVHGPRSEMYDLANDPRELDDLHPGAPERADEMKGMLEAYLAKHAVEDLDASVALNAESAAKLQALGYLQNAGDQVGPLEERLRSDGDPPQDHAGALSLYSHAKSLLTQSRPIEARELLQELLRGDPGNSHYLELLAQSELRIGNADAALTIYDDLAARDDSSVQPDKILHLASQVLMRRGELDEAYDKLRRAEATRETAAGQYRLGKIHEMRDELHDAARFFENSLAVDSSYLAARLDLAVAKARLGEAEQAEALFEESIRDNPYVERTHYNYAVFLLENGRLEEALIYLWRAVELHPEYLKAHAALAETFAALGEKDEVGRHLAALERIAPDAAETKRGRELLESL